MVCLWGRGGIEMNHLGNTNKMVSATPRMDASAHDDGAIWETGCDIERELNAANVEIEERRKDVVWLATEKAKSENYVTELENRLRALWDKYDGDRKHYMDRIKRLEEAGDAMFPWSERVGQEFWTKAKEAKL